MLSRVNRGQAVWEQHKDELFKAESIQKYVSMDFLLDIVCHKLTDHAWDIRQGHNDDKWLLKLSPLTYSHKNVIWQGHLHILYEWSTLNECTWDDLHLETNIINSEKQTQRNIFFYK